MTVCDAAAPDATRPGRIKAATEATVAQAVKPGLDGEPDLGRGYKNGLLGTKEGRRRVVEPAKRCPHGQVMMAASTASSTAVVGSDWWVTAQ